MATKKAKTPQTGRKSAYVARNREAILKAALIRQETRGSHWRADFPETSDLWRKRIIQKLDQSGNWHTEYQEVK